MDAEECVKALAIESDKTPPNPLSYSLDITAWTSLEVGLPKPSLVKPRVVFQRKRPNTRFRSSRPPSSYSPPLISHDKGVGPVVPAPCSPCEVGVVRSQTPTGVMPSRSLRAGRGLGDLCRQHTEAHERRFVHRRSVHIPRSVAKSPINEFLAKTKLTVRESAKPRYYLPRRDLDCTGIWVGAKPLFT